MALDLLPPGQWRIESDAQGRPLVLSGDGQPGPDISISHSGPWVAAAAALQGRIGIDVETPRPGRDALGIARAYFSEAERNVVANEGQPALLAFWTMREAVAKALGGGLSRALALEGDGLVHARGAFCRGVFQSRRWVLAHRIWGEMHMALAWEISAPPSLAEKMLSGVLDETISVMGCATGGTFVPCR